MYFDTHCHLNSDEFDNDRDEVVQRAAENDVVIIDISTDIESSKKILEYQAKYKDEVYAVVGFHPEDVSNYGKIIDENEISNLKNHLQPLLSNKNIVGVGECGLDYYWFRKSETYSKSQIDVNIQIQQKVFRFQCELAKEHILPLIIHTRAIEEDTDRILNDAINILNSTNMPKGIFHSYTGTFAQAERFLSLGYYISFNGIVTFKKSADMRSLLRSCFENYPDQILIETDGPHLSPEGKRGQRNEPLNVINIYEFISTEIGIKIEDTIESNVRRIFKIQ